MHISVRRLTLLKAASAICAALAIAALAGCSNPYQQAPVRGRVTCNGKPAVGGTIIFQPLDAPARTGRPAGEPGIASSGVIGEDGSFVLASIDASLGGGAVIGPHQLIFQAPPTQRPTISADERAVMSPEEIQAAEEVNARLPVYPPLDCSTTLAPAEVEVKPGNNEFAFTLQPK
jgi:hypothetical protein